MELDPTILERLQELRRWQVEQQERLMKQQQEQREMLSFEQDRMYQALGLSVNSIVLDDTVAEKISNSPDKYGNVDNSVQADGIVESSTYESYAENDHTDESVACREQIDDAAIKNQPTMGLNVPLLQLHTRRYLNYKSSNEDFSQRSDILSDRENSVITTGSERTPEKNRGRMADLSIDGVEPLPADKPFLKHIAIDDLPVPSPKKDFATMLEERLKDCETMPDEKIGQDTKTVIKRPFLKKGEGLARFKPNPGPRSEIRRMRPRSSSLSANMHLSSSSGTKANASKPKDTPKSSKTVGGSSTKNLAVPNTAQSKLNLKNVPPPKRKVRSKSLSAVPINRSNVNHERVKTHVDMNNSSDFETKQRRESEEMRIFELLEEKAENSSFCSNSSTVLALFRQSTPLKPKNMQKNNRDSKQRSTKNSTNHESSDTSIEEIVRTTKSNKSTNVSPIAKIRETVVQKDIVFAKWDSGPFTDENTNVNSTSNNSKRSLQHAVAAASYKTTQHTKHTTIQFNNNNNVTNNNNNNNNRKPVVHSDDEDSRDTSCTANVDDAYKKNYQDVFDRKRNNEDELPADDAGPNVSLHVRFSEYNEYKTIGLTDTSMMSNDPNPAVNYAKDKAWSDRSTSPDSSDAEIIFTKNKSVVCPKISVAQNITSSSSRNDKEVYPDESTDRTTDDEQYASSYSTDNSYDGENTVSEPNPVTQKIATHVSDDAPDIWNDSGSTIKQDNDDTAIDDNNVDSVNDNGTIFKSELLKTRLSELEREIDIFRKENAALANQRKKLQEEQKKLQKEFKEKNDNLEKDRITYEEMMQDEKKRLAREKSALENRLRDAREKSLQTKNERQEMQILREQMDELRDETSQKESRWQATQARQKSQIRVLQTENAKLKQELERLRQSRNNGTRFRRPSTTSNTRAIHQINKQLEVKKKIIVKKDSSSDDETLGNRVNNAKEYDEEDYRDDGTNDNVDEDGGVNDDGSKIIIYNGTGRQSSKTDNEIKKKRNLYTNLLNEATEGLRGRGQINIGKSGVTLEKTTDRPIAGDGNDEDDRFVDASDVYVGQRNIEKSVDRRCENAIGQRETGDVNVAAQDGKSSRSPMVARNDRTTQRESTRSPDRRKDSRNEFNESAVKTDVREVVCPDGHVEYWYPNGNVKKVFPDRKVTKTIYYNGDVRENAEDGSVKYFYASTRTWHTTLPDGLEILEFPDGQVERRTKNGTIEVSFPDGSVRLLQADGTEKWVLPDGTIAETFPDGDKILSFPNGQREVHTKEHKRREYPDGTVKLVYPDGTQETRYSTGRVRVKDKDGNLIMDVHHR